ncbi:hypothetical protein D046_7468D, partial [Vibrio parahaemolyticus V-223/04]
HIKHLYLNFHLNDRLRALVGDRRWQYQFTTFVARRANQYVDP